MEERDDIIHSLRLFLRALLSRREEAFQQPQVPSSLDERSVDSSLIGGGGIIPAVGGTIVETPSLVLHGNTELEIPRPTEPPTAKILEGLSVSVGENTIVVHKGKGVTPTGKEVILSEDVEIALPSEEMRNYFPFLVLTEEGKVQWTFNILPTDIPLYQLNSGS